MKLLEESPISRPGLVLSFLLLLSTTRAQQATISNPTLSINNIHYSTRAYWMRQANAALSQLVSPCPFGAFGTVIVNHTAPGEDGLGTLVCMGANNISLTGNPTLHGKCFSPDCIPALPSHNALQSSRSLARFIPVNLSFDPPTAMTLF